MAFAITSLSGPTSLRLGAKPSPQLPECQSITRTKAAALSRWILVDPTPCRSITGRFDALKKRFKKKKKELFGQKLSNLSNLDGLLCRIRERKGCRRETPITKKVCLV